MRVRPALLSCVLLWGCESAGQEPRFEAPPSAKEPASGEKPPSALEQAAGGKTNANAQATTPPELPQEKWVRVPTSPDPRGGTFSLADGTAGLAGGGPLKASIETSLGTLSCTLYDDKAPNTVANFVGLARGLRPFWDAKRAAWVTRPLYDGTTFHRVIPGFMIQGGDHLGTGAGDLGYTINDELHPSLKHDRAGLLCMANRGPNTNGGQFFITDAAAPHLTAAGSYSIFGECGPTALISKIANAPKSQARREMPSPPVEIRSVQITR